MGMTIEYFFMYPLLFLYLSVKLVSFFQNIIEKKNTQEFPLLFPGEIRFLQVYLLINLAFICAMIQQVLTS